MATLIQVMQNILSQKDPLLPNETKRVIPVSYTHLTLPTNREV